jgi:membrane complex biogenesis BtpA family protein
MSLETCFGKQRVLLGVVHLPSLPGSPGYQGSMEDVVERALADAGALEEGGLDGAVVENFGDAPFFPDRVLPETVAAMAVVVAEIRKRTRFPLGINVLRNDAHSALAIVSACGAQFIRVNIHTGSAVTDQGVISGRAYETLRLMDSLWSKSPDRRPLLLADIAVKHATPLGTQDLEQMAEDTFHRGGADALLVTGEGTGKASSFDDVQRIRKAVPNAPVLMASGITEKTAARAIREAHGAIVGSWLKRDGKLHAPVDVNRVRALVEAARSGLAAGRQGGKQ